MIKTSWRVHRIAVVTCLFLAALVFPGRALADRSSPTEDERGQAAELKKQGDAAMVSLRYADALAAYDAALLLVDDPALYYNRGRALQGLGQFPEALEQLQAFDAKAPPELKAKVPALGALITEVRARVSTLSVTCNIAGARILVRDRIVGTTPLPAPLRLPSGRATVEIEAEGYLPYRKQLDLPGAATAAVDATLLPRSTTGVLVIRSPVTGARVDVDGKPAGAVPVELQLPAGSHQLVLRHDAYHDTETAAVVRAGERRDVSVPLDSVTPVTARWWFWTGVGVVVVGGVVLTAALLTERSPSKGDIPPGEVAAPIVRF
jgi:hypothetical protein